MAPDGRAGSGLPVHDQRFADEYPASVTVRMAEDEDGPRVGELVSGLMNGADLGFVDWSEVKPWWLVAEIEQEVVGCIQVSLGKPFGRIELLAVAEGLPHRTRAMAVKELALQGMATLQRSGAQVVVSMVSFDQKGWKKLLKKRGGVIMFSGHTFLKRLE